MKVKDQINQIIERLPEEILGDLLKYLHKIEETPSDKFKMSQNLSQILEEDSKLLEELAK